MEKNMKVIIVVFVLLSYFVGASFAEAFNPFPFNKGTIYEYENPPDICFFPPEKAKWNGYDIKFREWRQLTDYQKMMFVYEAIREVEVNEGAKVVFDKHEALVVGLNMAAEELIKKEANSTASVMTFVIHMLKDLKVIEYKNNPEFWDFRFKEKV